MYRRLRLASLELEEAGLTHLSGPERMRRNLAGARDPEALDTLASVLEPISFGDREDTQHTDWFTSLDRLVDSVAADPPARQEIGREVEALVNAHSHAEAAVAAMVLRKRFEKWAKAAPELEAAAQHSARFNDAGDRARQLGQLAQVGLSALGYLDAGATPPAGWPTSRTQPSRRRRSRARLCGLSSCRRCRSWWGLRPGRSSDGKRFLGCTK